MDVSGLVQYNNIEGGRIIKFHCFSKAGGFFQDEYTGIHQYFSLTTPFPSRKDTGIGALATREASGSVKRVSEKQARQ